MKRNLFAIFLILASGGFSLRAQVAAPARFTDRLSYGGNLSLGFGDITYILAAPSAGYKFTPRFTAGVGLLYQYVSYSRNVYGFEFRSTTFGERVFARHTLPFLNNVYLGAEYQNLHIEAFDMNLDKIGRIPVPVLLVGGGLLSPVGGKVYLNIGIFYDIMEDINSPYRGPVIQGGLVVNP